MSWFISTRRCCQRQLIKFVSCEKQQRGRQISQRVLTFKWCLLFHKPEKTGTHQRLVTETTNLHNRTRIWFSGSFKSELGILRSDLARKGRFWSGSRIQKLVARPEFDSQIWKHMRTAKTNVETFMKIKRHELLRSERVWINILNQ